MITSLYLPFENNIAMLVLRKIYIINNLKTNILIEINIIILEKINIITFQSKVMINSYNISMFIEVRIKDRSISYLVYTKKVIIISSHF